VRGPSGRATFVAQAGSRTYGLLLHVLAVGSGCIADTARGHRRSRMSGSLLKSEAASIAMTHARLML
jgi:hypothetical protein